MFSPRAECGHPKGKKQGKKYPKGEPVAGEGQAAPAERKGVDAESGKWLKARKTEIFQTGSHRFDFFYPQAASEGERMLQPVQLLHPPLNTQRGRVCPLLTLKITSF